MGFDELNDESSPSLRVKCLHHFYSINLAVNDN